MLKSPLIPAVFSILLFVFGCSSVEIKTNTSEILPTKQTMYKHCPKGTKKVGQKKMYLLCAQKKKPYYQNLVLLKKQKKKSYSLVKKWPSEQKFTYSNKIWQEQVHLRIEDKQYKLATIKKWQWSCTKQDCTFVALKCQKNMTTSLFPSIVKKIRNQSNAAPLNGDDILQKLAHNALNGDYRSLRILKDYHKWFSEKQISFSYAQYLKREIMQQSKMKCISDHNPYFVGL